jgi:hypothetical protein
VSCTYQPGHVPDDPKQIAYALRQEFSALKAGLEDAAPFHQLQILHRAPQRIRAGMVCYFDGTDYDPGSGEGVYVRDKANAAWRYLG